MIKEKFTSLSQAELPAGSPDGVYIFPDGSFRANFTEETAPRSAEDWEHTFGSAMKTTSDNEMDEIIAAAAADIKALGLPDDLLPDGEDLTEMLRDQYEGGRSVRSESLRRLCNLWRNATVIGDVLPDNGGIGQAVARSLQQKIREQYEEINRRQASDEDPRSNPEALRLHHWQRDLGFAVETFRRALEFAWMPGGIQPPDEWSLSSTYLWYKKGEKGRSGGYHATYTACNDTFEADPEDHAIVLQKLFEEDPEGYNFPDDFHHEATVEIDSNPFKRIEFLYTPEAVTAQGRHSSRSERTTDNGTRVYDNKAISIRIALDPNAPQGITLSIGRPKREREGDVTRVSQPDLMGELFTEASPHGHHEYTGFEPGMSDAFKGFAEQLSVQLHLQRRTLETVKQKQEQAAKKYKEAQLGRRAVGAVISQTLEQTDATEQKIAA